MSSITSTHFNWLPRTSAYNQLQTQRAQFAADNANFLDQASSLAGSFSDAMSSQYDGIANLAADAAAKRLGIALPSQSSTDTTGTNTTSTNSTATSSSSAAGSSSSSDSSNSTANSNDYMNTINQIINGTAAVTSQTQSEIASAGSAQAAIANMLDGANIGGTPTATVDQIINGTATLENSAPSQISPDGNMFTTIDRIINSSVAPNSVNVTA